MVVAMLAMFAGSLQLVTRASGQSQRASVERMQAHYLAEAALKQAFVKQRLEQDVEFGSQAHPLHFAVGDFWVEKTDKENGQGELVAFASVGLSHSGIKLDVEVEEPEVGVEMFGNFGIFGEEGVILDSGSRVSSYASGGTDSGSNATVASNAKVIVDNGARIAGDATAGPGYLVETAKAKDVSGTVSSAAEAFVLPTVEVPSIADSGPLVISGCKGKDLSSGDYHFSHLALLGKGSVTVHGPATVVLDSVEMEKGSELLIDSTDGPVQVYCLGDFVVAKGASIDNSTDVAADFQMYLMGDDVADPGLTIEVSTGADWHGVLYAPYAEIVVDHGTRFYGGLVARRVSLLNGSRVFQDVSATTLRFGSESESEEDAQYTILGWRGVSDEEQDADDVVNRTEDQ